MKTGTIVKILHSEGQKVYGCIAETIMEQVEHGKVVIGMYTVKYYYGGTIHTAQRADTEIRTTAVNRDDHLSTLIRQFTGVELSKTVDVKPTMTLDEGSDEPQDETDEEDDGHGHGHY